MIHELRLPQLGETVTEGTITCWHVAVGDHVDADAALYDLSTDKVDSEVPAPQEGWLRAVLLPEDATAPIGTVVGLLSDTADEPLPGDGTDTGPSGAREPVAVAASPAPSAPATADAPPVASPSARERTIGRDAGVGGAPFLSPAVRRLVSEHGVDVTGMVGSGADGRITRADVLAAVAHRDRGEPRTTPTAIPIGPLHAGDVVEPYGKARRATAARLATSHHTTVCTHLTVAVQYHRVEPVRRAAGHTYLPYVARAVIQALAAHPRLNAHCDDTELVLRAHVQLGIAVDTGDALLVPSIPEAETRRLDALAAEIEELANAARARRADLSAVPTFTLTNVGGYGTVAAFPVLPAPQVAILSVDGIRMTPIAEPDGPGWRMVVRPVGNLTLGFDHRAIDGAQAAAFLAMVRDVLEHRDWAAER